MESMPPQQKKSCGVCQGSVLSPVLFLRNRLNSLRTTVRACGLSINGLFIGALYANDIFSNLVDCKQTIDSFASAKSLILSIDKCEAVISPSNQRNLSTIEVKNIDIPVSQSARCLGAWWSTSLSSKIWIENNIKQARGAFFARGSGIFHRTPNPLSSSFFVVILLWNIPV